MNALLDKLDRIEAAALKASLPREYVWLDSNAAASMLSISVKHFRDAVACLPDFPVPSTAAGRRRWRAEEVNEWMLARRAFGRAR